MQPGMRAVHAEKDSLTVGQGTQDAQELQAGVLLGELLQRLVPLPNI